MFSISKKWAVALFCIGLVLAGTVFHLGRNYNGYCSAEGRWLTEEELYLIAIRDAYDSLFYDEKGEKPTTESERKTKIHSYVEKHPGCCKIIRNFREYRASENYRAKSSPEGYFHPTLWGRIWGDANYLIEIRYTGKMQNGHIYKTAGPRIMYRMIGVCGQIKDYFQPLFFGG